MNWSLLWECSFYVAAGTFLIRNGYCAVRRRETTVDQENGDPVTYTATETPLRFWGTAIASLLVGAILLGRFLWLLFS